MAFRVVWTLTHPDVRCCSAAATGKEEDRQRTGDKRFHYKSGMAREVEAKAEQRKEECDSEGRDTSACGVQQKNQMWQRDWAKLKPHPNASKI